MTKEHNALQTLWGSGDPTRDRARKNTAKSMISPGTRPQEIYTPQCIVDGLLRLWPNGIDLDPCSGPDSIVPAEGMYDGIGDSDGLGDTWDHSQIKTVYVNCPFKDLKKWLAKAAAESRCGLEIVMLCPTRHHRKWFRAALGYADCTIYLNPLKFHGYAQAFPAPLCLIGWNVDVDRFKEAFKDLGEAL